MKKEEKGFTLVEMLVSTMLLVLIMYSVFMMIDFQMEFSKTQQAQTRMQQESRYLLTSFAADLKNAGAILTLAHTGSFLADTPYFNGIFPINGVDAGTNDTYPDGIIIAAGDPDAVTSLTAAVALSPGATLPVKSTAVVSPALPWSPSDKGILISSDGYYVFSVASVGTDGSSITMASTPVYYSGMLNSPVTQAGTSTGYVDSATNTGDSLTYPMNAPVMRLSNFGIYLVDERFDAKLNRNIRQLVKVNDANGDTGGDFLSSSSSAIKGVIAENIWDFQISYFCYPNYPDHTVKNEYFTDNSTGNYNDLMVEIRGRSLKEIVVNVVALSEEHAGKGTFTLNVPQIGDCSGYILPTGKYNYQIFTLSIDPRNFNISL